MESCYFYFLANEASESSVGSVSSNGENFLSPLLASHLTKIKPEQTKCFTVFELSGLSGCVPLFTGLITWVFKISRAFVFGIPENGAMSLTLTLLRWPLFVHK